MAIFHKTINRLHRLRKLWKSGMVGTCREAGVWGGAYPYSSLGVWGVTPAKLLKIYTATDTDSFIYMCKSVQYGVLWGIKSSKVGRKIDAFPSHFWKWDGIYRFCGPWPTPPWLSISLVCVLSRPFDQAQILHIFPDIYDQIFFGHSACLVPSISTIYINRPNQHHLDILDINFFR